MVRDLTPYDTGERAEPRPWPTGGNADRDDFGKVDFDNDESRTLITLWVERRPEGGHVVKGYAYDNEFTVDIDEIDDGRERAIHVIKATYEAADGDSNDAEIQILQEARDLLADLVGYKHEE